jgi:hypothetical protein
MQRIWAYDDYVEHLSHPSSLVRKWAYDGITEQYPRRFCREISRLIDDSDRHLACRGAQYLAAHGAVEFAPAIFESFMKREGTVAYNCACALGKLGYEDVFESMTERMKNTQDIETFLGIAAYLGDIHTEESHELLRNAFIYLSKTTHAGSGVSSLISYGDPEDVMYVYSVLSTRADDPFELKNLYRSLMDAMGVGGIYHDLMETWPHGLLKEPAKALERLLSDSPGISLPVEFQKEIVKYLSKSQYRQLSLRLHASATEITKEKLPDENNIPHYHESIYTEDLSAITLLAVLAGNQKDWKRFQKNKDGLKASVCAALAAYLGIVERGRYLEALSPHAPLTVLMEAVKNSGRDLPERISDRLIRLASVDALKKAFTQNLRTWSDIHIVRIMGQIGSKAFIPDLVRVIADSDPLDYIHDDALKALYGIEDSGHPAIFSAIRNGEITDAFNMITLLEHLPYAESYDLATRIWDDDEEEGSIEFEFYGHCLKGIGDKRGIEELQEILDETNAHTVGDALETLALLHNMDIPELPMIREKRKEHEKRLNERLNKLDALVQNASERLAEAPPVDTQNNPAQTVRRSEPKVGRNDPCPCGSGKKYKKCCLNKNP